jgi:hypothetical protein
MIDETGKRGINGVRPTPPQYQQTPPRTAPAHPRHRTAPVRTSTPNHSQPAPQTGYGPTENTPGTTNLSSVFYACGPGRRLPSDYCPRDPARIPYPHFTIPTSTSPSGKRSASQLMLFRYLILRRENSSKTLISCRFFTNSCHRAGK